MKELTSGVVDDDYDDDDQGSAMIFAPAAMRSTCCCMCGDNLRVRSLCKRLAHIATANFLPARQRREGKGSREGKKGREEGKGREGRDFPVCRQSTTLSADSRGAHGRRHLCCRRMHVHPSMFPLLHPPYQLILPR